MLKKTIIYLALFISLSISPTLYAGEYLYPIPTKNIHTVIIISQWCGNILLSTKVGKMTATGECAYQRETAPSATDNCGPHYLNGGILEQKVGRGYTCAATHAHSNVSGKDGVDEFLLISDAGGHYITSHQSSGKIQLNK